MLFLVFQLGDERYALDAGVVAEVLPLVRMKRIPQAPPGLAGLFDYHGAPVPALDLSELACGRPAQLRMSTRILLVRYPDEAGRPRPLGLIAERVTQTLRREAADFVASGVSPAGAPYLGAVATDGTGMLQRIDFDKLLSTTVRDVLSLQARQEG